MSSPKDLRRLPDGVADFAAIRNPARNYLYADKTKLLYELLANPDKPYFLSRPRRFGKTLLVSALEAILRGRRELFEARRDDSTGRSIEGLWIAGPDSDYHFRPGPVIKLSLASASSDSVEKLENSLNAQLNDIAKIENLALTETNPPDRFGELILGLYQKYDGQKPAVLIDEYDAPVLSEITKPDLAVKIRETLAKFYATLKDYEDYRGFTFITGVTKFVQLSMFSSLNNLRDLTLWEDYAAICGFTVDDEFDALFGDRLGVALERLTAAGALSPGQTEADLRDAILEKYDGYSWDGRTRVLNPWSVLSFFLELYFGDFWVTTGQPSHLIKLLKRSDAVSQISICIDNDINAVDIESFNQEIKPLSSNITVLMFQAGYLTVNNVYYKDGKRQYLLKIPNNEVNSSLIQLLIGLDSKQTGKIRTIAIQSQAIAASIANKDPAGFIEAFSCFLDVAPYHDHEPWEGYYLTSLLYALLFAGAICNPEGAVGGGRYDLHMRSEAGDDYIIEVKRLKKDDTESAQSLAAAALEQIELKRYASMFKGGPGRVFKVAVVVSDRTCVLAVFEPVDNWTLATLADGTRKVAKANPA